MIKCEKCGSNMLLREGQYGSFAGCSNYPECKATMKIDVYKNKLADIIYSYLEKEGINIYGWERTCWHCKKPTRVITYFLHYQIEYNFPDLQSISKYHNPLNLSPSSVGLGDIATLDNYLSQKYPTIKSMYSGTRQESSISNICGHCGKLQGRNFVVNDPHEVMGIMLHHPEEFEKKIIMKVKPSEAGLSKNIILLFVLGYI